MIFVWGLLLFLTLDRQSPHQHLPETVEVTVRSDGSTRFVLERFPYKDVKLEFKVVGPLRRSQLMDAFAGAGCPVSAAKRLIAELEEYREARRPVSTSVNLRVLRECLDGSGVRFEEIVS